MAYIHNSKVLISDGSSERGAHVSSNICDLICLRHLIRSRAVKNRFFSPKRHRETDRDRQRDIEREIQRHRDTETQRHRDRDRKRDEEIFKARKRNKVGLEIV